jgi:hypothetical protein
VDPFFILLILFFLLFDPLTLCLSKIDLGDLIFYICVQGSCNFKEMLHLLVDARFCKIKFNFIDLNKLEL